MLIAHQQVMGLHINSWLGVFFCLQFEYEIFLIPLYVRSISGQECLIPAKAAAMVTSCILYQCQKPVAGMLQ